MPIYEFKCTRCEAFFEVIVRNSDNDEVRCPECRSDEFERVVSRTNFAVKGGARGSDQGVSSQTRNCASGSCTTYTVPGDR